MLTIKQAIVDITNDNEFKELQKFQLSERDWDLLKDYQQILQVLTCLATLDNTDINCYVYLICDDIRHNNQGAFALTLKYETPQG